MSQWLEVRLTASSVICSPNFYLYAQHNTKQFLKCNLPLYKLLKNLLSVGSYFKFERNRAL